jgi:phage shock protein C
MAGARRTSKKGKPSRRLEREEFRRRAVQAGDEMRGLGRDFGQRMERRIRPWQASPWSLVFSFVFSIVFFALGIWVLDILYGATGVRVFSVLAAFFADNFPLFVLLFMFTALLRFIAHTSHVGRRLAWPISFGLSWSVMAWIASTVIIEGRIFSGNMRLWEYAVWLNSHLLGVFAFFAVAGYVFVLAGLMLKNRWSEHWEQGDYVAQKGSKFAQKAVSPDETRIKGKRLYRSGREKILGGVCGGIAEYFGVDPTIVRLVWVLLSLAWGFGVLLYLIMWVITPRNPRDEWRTG